MYTPHHPLTHCESIWLALFAWRTASISPGPMRISGWPLLCAWWVSISVLSAFRWSERRCWGSSQIPHVLGMDFNEWGLVEKRLEKGIQWWSRWCYGQSRVWVVEKKLFSWVCLYFELSLACSCSCSSKSSCPKSLLRCLSECQFGQTIYSKTKVWLWVSIR